MGDTRKRSFQYRYRKWSAQEHGGVWCEYWWVGAVGPGLYQASEKVAGGSSTDFDSLFDAMDHACDAMDAKYDGGKT